MNLRKHPLFSNGGYIANHIDVICRCLDINIILSHIQYFIIYSYTSLYSVQISISSIYVSCIIFHENSIQTLYS